MVDILGRLKQDIARTLASVVLLPQILRSDRQDQSSKDIVRTEGEGCAGSESSAAGAAGVPERATMPAASQAANRASSCSASRANLSASGCSHTSSAMHLHVMRLSQACI